MDREKIDRWLSHFGLTVYLLFLMSLFFGEYVSYMAIAFILVCGTPLSLLWVAGRLRPQGNKIHNVNIPKELQGKVSLQVKDVKQTIDYKRELDENRTDEKVESESEEAEIKALLRKAVAHGAS